MCVAQREQAAGDQRPRDRLGRMSAMGFDRELEVGLERRHHRVHQPPSTSSLPNRVVDDPPSEDASCRV